jgi:hypothetical protein
MTVRYFAISKTFPHHLNTFDNFPINYTKGPLTNISVASTTVKFYANSINYTAQATANGYTYKNFTTPYTNFQILLFMTSLFHSGVNEVEGAPVSDYRPLNLRISTSITSSAMYLINATYSIESSITRLHFSILIFN